ncbi:hypothetical protein CCP3SC1AL1_4150002 [Gammaproteobacteria bacterium]
MKSGWWISTIQSRATIRQVVEVACGVAGLKFGSDLILNLGD